MGITASTSASLASQPAARIVGSHGYCIDGDVAYLNADIEWSRHANDTPAWALQLWAHPAEAASESSPVLVAELPLQSFVSRGDDVAHVEGSGVAMPPAGTEPYTMVLQLSTWSRGGADLVHDQVAFAQAEQFVQPRLQQAAYRFEGDRLVLQAGRIENPRAADNLSGSLVLELWALAEPYRGGAFEGTCIGSAALGRLEGQQAWVDVDVSTVAAPRPAALRHSSLMLREWTAAGYLTRDYVNGEAPVPVEEQAAAPAAEPIEVTAAVVAETGSKPAAEAVIQPADEPLDKPAAKAAPQPAGTVSINRADVDQLTTVKGLPKTVAKAIVASRPFGSVDGLLELKGMGPKLLEKIRRYLSL